MSSGAYISNGAERAPQVWHTIIIGHAVGMCVAFDDGMHNFGGKKEEPFQDTSSFAWCATQAQVGSSELEIDGWYLLDMHILSLP